MLTFVIIFALGATIGFDLVLLKRQNSQEFKNIFQVPRKTIYTLLFMIVFVLYSSEGEWKMIFLFLLSFAYPLYLLRRHWFMRFLTRHETDYRILSKDLFLCDAFGIAVVWFYSLFVVVALTEMLLRLFEVPIAEIEKYIFWAIFSLLLLLFLVYKASRKFSKDSFLENMKLYRRNRSFVKVIVIPALIGLFFSFISVSIVMTRETHPQTPLTDLIDKDPSPMTLLMLACIGVLFAPLLEEVVFRGYFFYAIREARGVMPAILSVSLVFAFLHIGQYWGDWLAILMVTLFGFSLTIIRAWTGTTLASAVAHYVYNGGVVMVPFFLTILYMNG